jgi:3',5'-cyclic AMP phosphodiesterase CpdA
MRHRSTNVTPGIADERSHAPHLALTGRILHISDLHVGQTTDSGPLAALRELSTGLDPEVLVVTGDLAHRGRRAELERAHEMLLSFGLPLVAVPGNHDLPYRFPARFTRSTGEWERVFGTTEPVYASQRLTLVGLNSVRPWRLEGGALPSSELERVAHELAGAAPGSVGIAALHHHLAAPPWRAAHKRPLRDRDSVLRVLASAGVELVLSGHVHQSAAAERREFEVLIDDEIHPVVLATAAGFGRPRPRRRGEAIGFNLYEAEPEAISVATWSWSSGAFHLVARRTFHRGTHSAATVA